MPYPIEKKLVIAVSSSALFDLTESDSVFRRHGIDKYRKYQEKRIDVPLEKGVAYPFIKRLLSLNNSSQPIIVINNQGGVINIYNNEVIQNPSTQESINEIATTVIENPKVDSLSIKYERDNSDTSQIDISKHTLQSVIRDIPDNELSNKLYKQELEIISPVFVAEPRNWKVLLNGKSVSVYLRDLDFLETMKAQGIAFGFGDKIVADIDVEIHTTEKSTKTRYTVTKVISYPRYTKITWHPRLPMFNDEDSNQ